MILAVNVAAVVYLGVFAVLVVALAANVGRGVHGRDREAEDENETPSPGHDDD